MRLAYADPPYLGCCKLYDHEHHGGGCWDDPETHRSLLESLAQYDGWVLHLSTPSLPTMTAILGQWTAFGLCMTDWRVMAWVKPFAAFKRNVSVAYAWEPVIVKAARKPEVTGRVVMRDWIAESITLKRGLTGAKPEKVCMWAFEMMGAQRDDELVDLFPGSGAVSRAWDTWRSQFDFATASPHRCAHCDRRVFVNKADGVAYHEATAERECSDYEGAPLARVAQTGNETP